METRRDRNRRTRVALVFDDGFTASCHRIARIFEDRGLSAVFAVLVNHEGFMPAFPKSDFALWNELQARGHVLHPHGFDHSDLSAMPHDQAVRKVDACLEAFSERLDRFDPAESIYHFTYNRSTPALDAHLLGKVRAVRSTGQRGEPGTGMNTQADLDRRVLSCAWHGPGPCDEHLLAALNHAKAQCPPLFLYMLHGLDGEGWGPLGSATLERVLDELAASDELAYDPLTFLERDHHANLNP